MTDSTAATSFVQQEAASVARPAITLDLPGAPSPPEIEQILPAYIAAQRWFGGKSRHIAEARIASSARVPGSEAVLTTVAVHYEDRGPGDLYQLPLAIAYGEEAAALKTTAPKAVLTTYGLGESVTVLYDATAGIAFRTALLQLITEAVPSRSQQFAAAAHATTFAAERSATLDPAPLRQAPSRVGSAEQSNTSILYGDRAILKLFRRLRHGENPDVEIARFLTETARFAHIPAYFGDLHLASDRTTLGFLQQFAPNQGDGWDWTMEALGSFYASVADHPLPDASSTLPGFSSMQEIPDVVQQHAGEYLQAAALLGRRTGEMHLALATATGNHAFSAESYSASDLDADRLRIGSQADAALDTLAAKLSAGEIDSGASHLAAELLQQREAIRNRATDLAGDPALFGKRIRIHGDYHLGQLLRSGEDFLIVDFEGEPAKTMEERRRKQTPLKDVAGMLRSFSYAARSALDRYSLEQSSATSTLQPWAALWENAVCAAYLHGYREATGTAASLLPQPAQADALLSGLLLEKALYELLYELNNRPTWLHIPLSGLLALVR